MFTPPVNLHVVGTVCARCKDRAKRVTLYIWPFGSGPMLPYVALYVAIHVWSFDGGPNCEVAHTYPYSPDYSVSGWHGI